MAPGKNQHAAILPGCELPEIEVPDVLAVQSLVLDFALVKSTVEFDIVVTGIDTAVIGKTTAGKTIAGDIFDLYSDKERCASPFLHDARVAQACVLLRCASCDLACTRAAHRTGCARGQ